MTYRISGLDGAAFAGLFALDDAELAARNARRVTVTAKPGFPCRITLDDAEAGEDFIMSAMMSRRPIDRPMPFMSGRPRLRQRTMSMNCRPCFPAGRSRCAGSM